MHGATALHVAAYTIASITRLFNRKLRIFQMPSSHAKGSLALLVNNKYCLLGDALYPAHKGDKTVYNARILKQQIDILKKMAAPYVLLSHREPFVQKKQAVISWLEKKIGRASCRERV